MAGAERGQIYPLVPHQTTCTQKEVTASRDDGIFQSLFVPWPLLRLKLCQLLITLMMFFWYGNLFTREHNGSISVYYKSFAVIRY